MRLIMMVGLVVEPRAEGRGKGKVGLVGEEGCKEGREGGQEFAGECLEGSHGWVGKSV